MSKKRKRDLAHDHDQDDSTVTQEQPHPNPQTAVSDPPAKSKGQLRQAKSEKRSKKQRKSREQETGQETSVIEGTATSAADAVSTAVDRSDDIPQASVGKTGEKTKKPRTQRDDGEKKTTTPTRFIVFVGNLPFETTPEQIKKHFSKIAPTSVRLSTDKKTGKSKGFAFVEFDNYDKMKTCLKLYHHSMFEPDGKERGTDGIDGERNEGEQSPQRQAKKGKGRRINVELTAGGGGKKSKDRQAKIKTRNEKLKEERERRRIKEKAEREKAGLKKKGPPETGANAIAVADSEVKDDRRDIHPSRLSRVML
ncbi:uncharacterized protein A1O5_04206 [Cladophialophora psammophila CBS 110553]|uniref:RRM domain-containing protein n=1 Tax=Cladophialophora psammophila CBS 110553 TaxID=1182543 RepID=W9WXW2_9EURO|nr:uncharacterized protein A1O5_04206 [Cladophialophora psammophila CBS 110553]EXJ73057.1 hypothetical protein A1O5_04206 [Cladophialophora psammophila CBS 110553]